MCARLADQLAILLKQRAGKVQPVFDIWRKSSPPKHDAHFITNGRNPAGEKLQFYGIHVINDSDNFDVDTSAQQTT